MTTGSCRRAARSAFLRALLVLGLSALLGTALRASTDPVDGDAA